MKFIITERQFNLLVENFEYVDFNDIPKILYHGSNYYFTKSELDPLRKGIDLTGHKSGSVEGGVGIYLTPNLDPTPGTWEYAKKWAEPHGKFDKGFVYKVELDPDIKLIKGPFMVKIPAKEALEYLSKGIDGIYDDAEMVIFNKDKIKKFEPYLENSNNEKFYQKFTIREEPENVYNIRELENVLENKLGSGFDYTDESELKSGGIIRTYVSADGTKELQIKFKGATDWKEI